MHISFARVFFSCFGSFVPPQDIADMTNHNSETRIQSTAVTPEQSADEEPQLKRSRTTSTTYITVPHMSVSERKVRS